MLNLVDAARKLARGTLRSRELVEACLAGVEETADERAPAYLTLYAEAARAEADAVDNARRQGWSVPRYAGIPIAIADLFDVAGETTRAASMALADAPRAVADAISVSRIRAAGLLVLGKSNTSELGRSGLGINPGYGTPLAPYERARGRVAGGSAGGGAVAVAEELAHAALGADTVGGCRVPAAFCETVGFKPTAGRIPTDGLLPLAPSLDTVGGLASTVSCCAVLDDVLTGGRGEDVSSFPEAGLRLGVLDEHAPGEREPAIADAFTGALTRLSRRGVRLAPLELPEIEGLRALVDGPEVGGIVAAEAYAYHRERLRAAPGRFGDPVRAQLQLGEALGAADYLELLARRAALRESVAGRAAAVDAIVLPTVGVVPPELARVETPADAGAIDCRVVADAVLANVLDRPSITIPCSVPGEPPVGLMLIGTAGEDRRLLSIARGIEHAVRIGAGG